jgi:hypothetical protein
MNDDSADGQLILQLSEDPIFKMLHRHPPGTNKVDDIRDE